MSNVGVTIVVPALNEQTNLRSAINSIQQAATGLQAYEIVIVNDGSVDQTGQIADQLTSEFPNISAVHNPVPYGVGWAFSHGLTTANFAHLTVVPGDNAYAAEGLAKMFAALGKAPLIVSRRDNQFRARPFWRALISHVYCRTVSLWFKLGLPDVHGAVIYPVKESRCILPVGNGYTYQLETLVRLKRNNIQHEVVPIELTPSESSKAIRLRTMKSVMSACLTLRRERYAID
jgi:glycosyltransferase involved in cell wall biosynthesis